MLIAFVVVIVVVVVIVILIVIVAVLLIVVGRFCLISLHYYDLCSDIIL